MVLHASSHQHIITSAHTCSHLGHLRCSHGLYLLDLLVDFLHVARDPIVSCQVLDCCHQPNVEGFHGQEVHLGTQRSTQALALHSIATTCEHGPVKHDRLGRAHGACN